MMERIKYNTLYSNISDNSQEFVLKCEKNYENFLRQLAKKICDEKINRVFVCGQSASGKTTTTQLLSKILHSLNVENHLIELDDFFLERDKIRKNKLGNADFETVFALDLKSLYQMSDDIKNQKSILMPDFDFMAGKPGDKKNITIDKNSVLIIEGIHSFNDRVLNTFSTDKVLKVFIGINSELQIEDAVISNTELRFLRRLVRDYNYRNSKPDWTYELWKMVRAGEKRYVSGYKKKADMIFNTFLPYELFALHEKSIELLKMGMQTPESHLYYKRLYNKISKVDTIDNVAVPENSILKEFI